MTVDNHEDRECLFCQIVDGTRPRSRPAREPFGRSR